MASSSSSSLSIELVHPPQQPQPSFLPRPGSSSSFTTSHTYLEFLSCLQTDQVMPIHKINDVVIPTLIHNLSKCNPLLCSPESEHPSPLKATYEKICTDLSNIKGTLGRLKEWEHRLNTLTKKMMFYDWEAAFCTEGTNSVEALQTAIPRIDEMISEVKSHISLPLETSLEAQYSDISHLSTPENAVSFLKWCRDFQENDAFVNFEERYNRLDIQQQNFLLYFSFFPENTQIRKKVPTYLWMGEGETHTSGAEDLVDVADRLLKVLIANRFIEPVDEKEDIGDFNVCSINPDTRSALLTIAHRKGFFEFDPDGNPTADSLRAWMVKSQEGSLRHSSMTSDNNDNFVTLFNINENILDFPDSWLSKKKNISVIHVGNWSSSSTGKYIEAESSDFLRYLGDAKHLRCLSLNGITGIAKLPNSISKLEYLTILDLKSCRDLENLPRQIGMLKRLTHLDLSDCPLLDKMPKGLASLSELRVLKGFIINRPRKHINQCTLGDLVKLEKLRKLSLYADKETTGENGELNCISEFRSLTILTISWTAPIPSKSKPNKKFNATSVASPLLPIGLHKLDLRGWPLSSMPSWIKPSELNSLEKLYIRGGRLATMVCELPQWKVKILRLKFLKELSLDWKEVHTFFPRLVYLEKVYCPRLSSFRFEGVSRVRRFEIGSTSGRS
ncbi:hypothetical protein C3L33_08812, partial [Rhododendron williamsianum]